MGRMAMRGGDDFGDGDARRRPMEDEDERGRRSRPGLFGRMYRLVRFLVFIMPLSLLLIGSFLVDCRNRAGNALVPDFVRASACAREDLTGRLSSLDDTMRIISRAIH